MAFISSRKASNRKNSRVISTLQCDTCDRIFERHDKGHYHITQKNHFCSQICLNDANRKDGWRHAQLLNDFKQGMNALGVENASQLKSVQENRIRTWQEKYGPEATCLSRIPGSRQRAQQTFIERYDTLENAYQIFKQRGIETSRQKYGTDFPAQSNVIKQQAEATCLEKYGVPYTSQVPEFREQAQKTLFKNHGVLNPWQTKKAVERRVEAFEKFIYGSASKPEEEFYTLLCEFFLSADIKRRAHIKDKRTNRHWFIDFLIISKNIYIQLDGVYWHGLTKPYDQLPEQIKRAFDRDRRQDEWALETGNKLIRITDVQFNEDRQQVIELLQSL